MPPWKFKNLKQMIDSSTSFHIQLFFFSIFLSCNVIPQLPFKFCAQPVRRICGPACSLV